MQQPPPNPQRPHILTWLLAFGFIALLVGQFRLADQIKSLRKDRDDLTANLATANQQLAELSQDSAARETRETLPSATSFSPQTDGPEARIAELEQRINILSNRAITAPPRNGFEYNVANPPPESPLTVGNEDPAKRGWGEEQVTGPPNTPTASDASTAWASRDPDSGPEWLAVQFEKPVDIAEVRIRESYNPGAITRVVAVANNHEIVLWEGSAVTGPAPRDFVVPVSTSIQSATIHIHLDTARVSGWNEIDAVELIGKDGIRQWATGASASSTYAARNTPTNP